MSKSVAYSYKALHSIVPCLMLTMSVGMIYAFSLFIPELITVMGYSKGAIQFAFNMSIFFLGMGAAFFGPLVERDIRNAAWIATGLFVGGLAVTALAVSSKSIMLLYCGIGLMCGIGEGIAYLCPCKNMLLWYSRSKFKGLVMAVSIVTFGLGSSLCAQVYGIIFPVFGLTGTLWTLVVLYAVMMTVGSVFIRKPKFDTLRKRRQRGESHPPMLSYFGDSYVRSQWMFMFLNISMGLILIGSCASILKDAGLAMGTVVLVMSICGMTNGGGRILFPLIGDVLKRKGFIIAIILLVEVLLMAPSIVWYWMIPVSVICINATYGGGFATCPQIVLERYGSKPLSVIHGLLLSAWGMASIFAYFVLMVISWTGMGYRALPAVLVAIYLCALVLTKKVWHNKNTPLTPMV